MDIAIFLLIGLGIAPLYYILTRHVAILLSIAYLAVFFSWAIYLIHPFTTNPIAWVDLLDIRFSFELDGVTRLFILLISGIGMLVFGYASSYFHNKNLSFKKLLFLLQLFTVSMLALVLMDNLISLFVAWELTSITSYLLIQFDYTDNDARTAAFNGLFISVMGGLGMLAGFILLNLQFDTWSIQTITEKVTGLQNQPASSAAFWLVFFGAITKSAQFPFYFWLRSAMKAPTPVSAFLHSATMVNAGIYLLARFHPIFAGLSVFYPALASVGLSTMLVSSLLSLLVRDLKAILAYTTIFSLGSMVYLLAGNNYLIAEALAVLLFVHALYKALLFMLTGIIDKRFQTRDITHLKGIGILYPRLGFLAIIGFIAMAGLPPFFGFASKEMIYEAKLIGDSISIPLITLSMLSGIFIATTSFKCLFIFFSKPDANKIANKSMPYGSLYPFLLAILVVWLSFIPNEIQTYFLLPAAKNIIEKPLLEQLIVVPSRFGIASWLSLITIIGGVILFIYHEKFEKNIRLFKYHWHIDPERLFQQLLNTILRIGEFLTRITEQQSLTRQLEIILFFLIVSCSIDIFTTNPNLSGIHFDTTNSLLSILCGLTILTSISMLFIKKFLSAIITLGILGLILSFFFIFNGAIDVAITQILIEILVVIVLVIAYRNVDLSNHVKAKHHGQIVSFIIAASCGYITVLLILVTQHFPLPQHFTNFYITHAYKSAHGKNIVNTILVDFRSLDTLGEVLVILAAAVGIATLSKKKKHG